MSKSIADAERLMPHASSLMPAQRVAQIELSLIRQINALATPLSTNLGIGEPNLEPDDRLKQLALRATEASWHYSPNAGNVSLRKKLADGTPYDPKTEICVTAGTQEGLFAIFQAFVEAGDEVLVPNPGFVSYATLATMCGATVVTYELEPPDWKLDADALLAKVTPRTKLIIVNSPSNPLGAVIDDATLRKIAGAGCLVVADEVYRELWYDAPPPSMIGLGQNVIVINGLSKSHGMTGLRLGWIFADAELMTHIVKAHQYVATCASVFSQALAELILDDRDWNATWLANARSMFRTQRDAALSAIRRELDTEIPPPAGAFYAFVPVPSCDTLTFAKSLATDGAVLVIPGIAFGSIGEGFVRISYAASIDAIGTGIERMGRYLRERGR
ncbi:MAG: aminotransferase [Acidobacteriota bacterium]|nr:aminotransferase [Acidobacteriota bacterium]